MTTMSDGPPVQTTLVQVQHHVPIGSKFKATHGNGRVGTVLAVELLAFGPGYVVEYDDAQGERAWWSLRDEQYWTWWEPSVSCPTVNTERR